MEITISSNGCATNWRTGVVCGTGGVPATPPVWIGDFWLTSLAPADAVSFAAFSVDSTICVTSAANGSRRYFHLAGVVTSAWVAEVVCAWVDAAGDRLTLIPSSAAVLRL